MVLVASLLTLLVSATVAQPLNISDTDAGGYYYSFEAAESANITLISYGWYYQGTYTIEWGDNAKFLGGKGWATGSAQ
jgi:hypothetical protein